MSKSGRPSQFLESREGYSGGFKLRSQSHLQLHHDSCYCEKLQTNVADVRGHNCNPDEVLETP